MRLPAHLRDGWWVWKKLGTSLENRRSSGKWQLVTLSVSTHFHSIITGAWMLKFCYLVTWTQTHSNKALTWDRSFRTLKLHSPFCNNSLRTFIMSPPFRKHSPSWYPQLLHSSAILCTSKLIQIHRYTTRCFLSLRSFRQWKILFRRAAPLALFPPHFSTSFDQYISAASRDSLLFSRAGQSSSSLRANYTGRNARASAGVPILYV